MAVTVIPRDTSGIQRQQLLQSGLSDFNRSVLESKKLEESKLSGISNRAQQEALTEQAGATAAATKARNAAIASLPKGVYNKLIQEELSSKGKTIANMTSQINMLTQGAKNQAQLDALEKDNMIKDFAIDKAATVKPYVQAIAEADSIIKGSQAKSAAAQAEKESRIQRATDFETNIKGFGPAGQAAAGASFRNDDPPEIYLKAAQDAEVAAEETKAKFVSDTKASATKSIKQFLDADENEFFPNSWETLQDSVRTGTTPPDMITINPKGFAGNKIYTLEDARAIGEEAKWFAGYKSVHEGQAHPDDPANKTESETSSELPTITTKAEYDKLASGTKYLDKNGKESTKR